MKLSGAQLILQCLKEEGVDTIFGYPGGAVIPLYDALYDEKEIIHIITAHEQGLLMQQMDMPDLPVKWEL